MTCGHSMQVKVQTSSFLLAMTFTSCPHPNLPASADTYTSVLLDLFEAAPCELVCHPG